MPVIKRRRKDDPTPEPPPVTPPAPTVPPITPPPQPDSMPTKLGSYGNASIDQWDRAFVLASERVRNKRGVYVNPHVMKAMMDVESGGNGNYPADRCRPCDGTDCVPACGPMQIKRRYHFHRCPECDFGTVPGQIELATHIIGDTMRARGRDEYDALVTVYFPGDDVNGTTQGSYVRRVRELVSIMERDAGGTTPAPEPPKPKPVTEADVLRLIAGPTAYVSFGFNEANMSCEGGPCHFYEYGVGHGTKADYMHTGDDIAVPRGTTIRTPLAGRVTCVGTQGEVVWDQGCGAFTDTKGGIGNVTVMTDVGLKLTFGHCSKALVSYNERVEVGEPVALSGTNRADHLHLDVVTKRNGTYWLNDPLPTLAAVMSGMSLPTVYADPIDIPQPSDFDVWWTVKALRDGVKVYQRADPNSPESFRPLSKGEEVEIVYFTISHVDGSMWAVTRNRRRIPVSGLDLSAIKEFKGG